MIDGGATQVAIGYNKGTDDMYIDAQQYWVAMNQNLDAAAADIYAGLALDTGDAPNAAGDAAEKRDEVYIFIAGARVKF